MSRAEVVRVVTESLDQKGKECEDERYIFPEVEQSWALEAICTPDAADTAWPTATAPNSAFTATQAKFIYNYCSNCPVKEACLVDALVRNESLYEIRGGLTPKQRLPLHVEFNEFGTVRRTTMAEARQKASSRKSIPSALASVVRQDLPSSLVGSSSEYEPDVLEGLTAISYGYRLQDVATFANKSHWDLSRLKSRIIALAEVPETISARAKMTIAVKNEITLGLLPIELRTDSKSFLKPRQKNIVDELLNGLAPIQISANLDITETQMGNTISAIRRKLGALSTPHVVRLVYETGLVPAPSTAKTLISTN